MAQQKQRKQLILTDNKIISTYLLYSRQRQIKNILFHTATATYTTQFYEW